MEVVGATLCGMISDCGCALPTLAAPRLPGPIPEFACPESPPAPCEPETTSTGATLGIFQREDTASQIPNARTIPATSSHMPMTFVGGGATDTCCGVMTSVGSLSRA